MTAYIVAKDQLELNNMNDRDLYYDQTTNKIYAIEKPPNIQNDPGAIPFIINKALQDHPEIFHKPTHQQLIQVVTNRSINANQPIPPSPLPYNKMQNIDRPVFEATNKNSEARYSDYKSLRSNRNNRGIKKEAAEFDEIKFSESFERSLQKMQQRRRKSQSDAASSELQSSSNDLMTRSKQHSSFRPLSRIPRLRTNSAMSNSTSTNNEMKEWTIMKTSPPKSYSSLFKTKRSLSQIKDNSPNDNDYDQFNPYNNTDQAIYKEDVSAQSKPTNFKEITTKLIMNLQQVNSNADSNFMLNEMVASPVPLKINSNQNSPNHVYFDVNSRGKPDQNGTNMFNYEKPVQPIVLQPRLQQQVQFDADEVDRQRRWVDMQKYKSPPTVEPLNFNSNNQLPTRTLTAKPTEFLKETTKSSTEYKSQALNSISIAKPHLPVFMQTQPKEDEIRPVDKPKNVTVSICCMYFYEYIILDL